jgi:hypothetical protein
MNNVQNCDCYTNCYSWFQCNGKLFLLLKESKMQMFLLYFCNIVPLICTELWNMFIRFQQHSPFYEVTYRIRGEIKRR